MASSRVIASTSPSHSASDLARFAQAAAKPGGGGGSGLGSMNVEELLRGIYGDMPTPVPASGGDRPMSPAPEIATRRTVDEVWKEITSGGGSGGSVAPAPQAVIPAGAGGGGGSEMTLEDFLAREGAVKEDEIMVSGPSAAAEGPVAMGFLSGAEGVGGRGGGGVRGRKRQMMDPVDRAAMQRQKRMIKNRESAARSRERKQAYIAELESLVTQLEEENAELLREQEERHQKRLKELERVTPVIVRKKPSRDLRRTNSMQW